MPDDLETGTSEASDLDTITEGADEETETPEETPEETDVVEDSSEEEESSDEDEDSEEEVEEEVEEEEEISDRLSWKEIKEKFPEVAKMKEFREVFHREKAFSDLFPTLDDAKDANEKSQALDFFDQSLNEGDPGVLLRALEPQVAGKLAENILPALYQVSPQLFNRAAEPMLVNMLNSVAKRAEDSKDQNLLISAKNVAKFLFGKFEIPAAKNRVNPEVEEEVKKLKEERQQLVSAKQTEFLSRTDKSIFRQLSKVVSDGLDPKGELTEFTKNAIIEKTLAETKAQLISDKAFSSKMANIFRAAEKAGFPPDYMPRLISAYLGRAKSIALTLRAKHKSAAAGKKTIQPKTRIEGSSEKKTTQTSTVKDSRKKSDLDIILEGS
jgi:hypothetical protein